MSRNPYFSHLPTWRNRQDLAYALDSLPRILTSFTSSYSSLHSSPYSSLSYSRSCSSFSSISTSSSIASDNSQHHQQQHQQRRLRYQRRLVERHLSSDYDGHSILLFSTRAQAMGFLIDILRSLQEEPCKCDLVQGCFCSPEGVEDHSGMAPCYVCGEWYAEQVYCRDEDTMEVYQVDGRRWHEQGASLRHHVAEASVREWLDQVVAVPQQQQCPQSAIMQRANTCPTEVEAPTRSTPTRSASTPTSFMIPQEILNPSCRPPGFRIRGKTTSPSPSPSPLPSDDDDKFTAPQTTLSSTTASSSTLRFSFTSERFKMAIQESMEKPSGAVTSVSSEPKAVDSSFPQGHVEECTEQQTASSVCKTSNRAVAQMEILESSASTAGTATTTIECFHDASFATVGNNNECKYSASTVAPEHPMAVSLEHASDEPSSEFGNCERPIQSYTDSAARPTAAVENTHAQAIPTTLSEAKAMPEENSAELSAAVSESWPSIRTGWQSMRRMLSRRLSNAVPVQQSWCGGSSRLAV